MKGLVIGCAVFICGLAATMAAGSGEAPTVEIEQPIGGWSKDRIIEVTGSVSDESIDQGVLVVNGYERWIDIQGGRFKATIVVSKGSNSIQVVASNSAGEGRDSVSFFSDVPSIDMQVILSWDTDGTDVDIHVTDPSGEECFFSHRRTKAGGKLDVDDTDGFGPEVFTLASALTGEYEVKVKYYSSHGHPQTDCLLQVVLFEGTDREKRLVFHKILTKTGDKELIGRFMVSHPQQADRADEAQSSAKGN